MHTGDHDAAGPVTPYRSGTEPTDAPRRGCCTRLKRDGHIWTGALCIFIKKRSHYSQTACGYTPYGSSSHKVSEVHGRGIVRPCRR